MAVLVFFFFHEWQNPEHWRGYPYFQNVLQSFMISRNKYSRAVMVGMYGMRCCSVLPIVMLWCYGQHLLVLPKQLWKLPLLSFDFQLERNVSCVWPAACGPEHAFHPHAKNQMLSPVFSSDAKHSSEPQSSKLWTWDFCEAKHQPTNAR